ncbi:MAG TPA: hypothetical protein VFQ35_18350 [Polyangiaceae bacterium]|nr:hypothetical protein [Polyangiaceae bacterium]
MNRHDDDVVSACGRVEDARVQAPVDSSGFMSRVRRVLFEQETSANSKEQPRPAPDTTATSREPDLVSGITATLRDLVTRDVGPALAEFNLQIEAVREVVPERSTQMKIALSVLSKKGIALRELERDLALVGELLAQQLESFSEKVAARRREHVANVEQVELESREARARAENEVVALEAALKTQRDCLVAINAQREKRLGEISIAEREIEQKERAFRSAQAGLLGEYERLGRDLAPLLAEKV